MALFAVKNIVSASQIDVAIRQLSTAIELYFSDGDIFSIYTLTRNAEEIISVLLEKRGMQSLWRYVLEEKISPEHRIEFQKIFDDPRNQLKHVRRGEDDIVELPVRMVEVMMFVPVNALHMYWLNKFKENHNCVIYNIWGNVHESHLYENKLKLFSGDEKLSKREFYTKHKRQLEDLKHSN